MGALNHTYVLNKDHLYEEGSPANCWGSQIGYIYPITLEDTKECHRHMYNSYIAACAIVQKEHMLVI